MPIPVACECGRQLMAKDEFAGRQTQCPDCGRELLIPDRPGDPASEFPNSPSSGPGPDPKPDPSPFAVRTDWEPGPQKIGPGTERTSGQAIASLILGLTSIFCLLNFLTGLPAIILGFLGLSEINKSHGQVKGKGLAITGLVTGFMGTLIMPLMILIALLLPAVQAAREAARRAQCVNNLKQMGIAMHNFHDAYGQLPPWAITDENGTPLLSWRVSILPFIERSDLYERFRLDEPWDSPHNYALLQEMPLVYACPSDSNQSLETGLTGYQVLAGQGTLFEPGNEGIHFGEVFDGTSNTIMVVESTDLVEWTRPADLDPDQPAVGSNHPGGFNTLFGDGSVRFLKDNIDLETLRALGTRAGGEVIPPLP